ncbi:oxidation resistance protein 1 [Coemansia sp. RSA 376]|nr:oxidation resistance protein 1 [Coemansia sp. RSA 376]
MSLRKYASTESDDSAPARPRSLASRLLHFGLGHSEHSSSGHSSEHGSGHGSDDEQLRQDDGGSDSSPLSEDPQTDTARATHEAMSTPITIPHSSTAPVVLGHHRPPIQLLGRDDDTPKVMTATIANELRPLLPVHQRLAKSWRLVYSMDQHGISFNTMLALCAREGAMMLAVKDTKGRVFGAFLNEPLRLSPTFYGQGSCFLWKAYKSSPQSRKKDAVKSFKYTGENEYFVMCDPDFVAIGGGRGKFGLWIKNDFLHGYSARCPTFNNEPLGLDSTHHKNDESDAQQEFVVGHFEIWAFNA